MNDIKMNDTKEVETDDYQEYREQTFKIRNADDPIFKEAVMSQLHSECLGFLKSNGLIEGEHYVSNIIHTFQISKRRIMIDRYNPEFTLNIIFKSLDLSVSIGLVEKDSETNELKKIIFQEKLENLRYNISSCTDLVLTDGSRKEYDDFFENYKKLFYQYLKK